jgi:hypothetical protein
MLHGGGYRSLAAGESTDAHEFVKLSYRTLRQLEREILSIFCNVHNVSLERSLSLPDIAVILMHGVHHELQGGVNNGSRLFGIKAFDQRGGAFEVGKQRSDGLTLTV